ncbi:MAG: hypothetical protein M0R46_12035 [Candidatus Muirbacterium halophilum]|nr:hypothetical protein [Candidatus Muirbacterium halophilum]
MKKIKIPYFMAAIPIVILIALLIFFRSNASDKININEIFDIFLINSVNFVMIFCATYYSKYVFLYEKFDGNIIENFLISTVTPKMLLFTKSIAVSLLSLALAILPFLMVFIIIFPCIIFKLTLFHFVYIFLSCPLIILGVSAFSGIFLLTFSDWRIFNVTTGLLMFGIMYTIGEVKVLLTDNGFKSVSIAVLIFSILCMFLVLFFTEFYLKKERILSSY